MYRNVRHQPLRWLGHGTLALTAVATAGLLVDERELLGVPIWWKPWKFGISFWLFAVMLAWLLPKLTRHPRTAWWAGTVVAVVSAGELAVVALQAVRGRPSHYNVTTALDEALWSAMGSAIMVLWLATLVIGVLLLQQRMEDAPLRSALRFGMAVALGGMLLGFLMAGAAEPHRISGYLLEGAHSVGVPDGGPGLPVTGWSTTGGDLRASHFAGLHALQLLPLLALLLGRTGLPERVRVRLIRVAAVGYSGLVAILAWQALRGQPLTRPDQLTLAAAGALAVTIVIAALLAARHTPDGQGSGTGTAGDGPGDEPDQHLAEVQAGGLDGHRQQRRLGQPG